ncbi:MAG: hypothetical protein Q8O98_00430 [bacterium]|nr:hypothetical protein [bacterium]
MEVSMPMSKERQGEIAILFLKNKLRKDGIRLTNIKRRINSEASEIEISAKEAGEFAELMIRELVDEAFDGKWEEVDEED